MPDDAATGVSLSRAFFDDVVAPLLSASLPRLRFGAGRLGTGSDVLGFDDDVSRDHDWGLRLSLFVPADAVGDVSALLNDDLSDTFRGLPARFAFTGESLVRHHVEVTSVREFAVARLGFDPRDGIDVHDWLSVSGQAALEVTAGAVFADPAGELGAVRRALAWYPDDLWRYVLASDWERIAQELPLMARAAEVGDDTGSRIVAARLSQVAMHLAFLLERTWPPYAKWFGSAFAYLPNAGPVGGSIAAVLDARNLATRHRGLGDALQLLLDRQNALGLTAVETALVPFWDRPHLHPDPAIATQLLDGITDPDVLRLPRGGGSIEQRTDNVAVLTRPEARRATVRAPNLNMRISQKLFPWPYRRR
ncbi:DUF4037 domain-containing protein [Leifsonia naganoensis]|uniref:DUF4037 domain-containing protein n=1 Tax=Leifsonia naganoensis TaxID=150025 RepID=A0A853DW37_9MICO|nr:hypothetical protein [Leifsonia naganoensis]